MNVREFLAAATEQLETAGITTARLDCLVLLEDVLNTNRAQLLAHTDLLIDQDALKKLQKLVDQRATHMPLAYLRNKTEFYGRELYIDRHVLEPRSESEAMIDLLKDLSSRKNISKIIDVGTGSGALAITAKLELPEAAVYAVDIDLNCLVVATKNKEQHKVAITTKKSDLLQDIPDDWLSEAVLLCNLPYVPNDFHINVAATHEPKLAIYGGVDGLDLYRALFEQIETRTVKPSYVLTESLPPQHDVLKSIAANAGFVFEGSEDFVQVFRTANRNSGL